MFLIEQNFSWHPNNQEHFLQHQQEHAWVQVLEHSGPGKNCSMKFQTSFKFVLFIWGDEEDELEKLWRWTELSEKTEVPISFSLSESMSDEDQAFS